MERKLKTASCLSNQWLSTLTDAVRGNPIPLLHTRKVEPVPIERNAGIVSLTNHVSKVFHDVALTQRISSPDHASVHLLNTALVHLAPKQFHRLQNNSGGTQSDDTGETQKPIEPERMTLAERFSKLAEQERSEDGHCWPVIRMKVLTTALQDRLFSSATSTYKSESEMQPSEKALNLCLKLPKPDDTKQKN